MNYPQENSPIFSNKLKRFLYYFFCQRSTRSSYEILSKIEKLVLFALIVKKGFLNFSSRCLCFDYIKKLEQTETSKSDDFFINFFLKRVFKHLANSENQSIPKQKERLKLFFGKYFKCNIVENFNFASPNWFKKNAILIKDFKQKGQAYNIKNIKHFVSYLHKKKEFFIIFKKENFHNITSTVFDKYYSENMQSKMKLLIKKFRNATNDSDFCQGISKLIFQLLKVHFLKYH